MNNITGSWIGELNGTNHGRMVVNLQHEGDRVYGEGHFNEPSLGTYQYQVQGIVTGEKVNLILTPKARSHAGIDLGNVEVDAVLENIDKMSGNWKSSIGTVGTFFVSKAEKPTPNDSKKKIEKSNSVFIVHGHDDATKEKVARFVEKLGLEAIILHEQVNKGMTVIEKFEEYSNNAGFAIALFTPDDIAYPLGEEKERKPRARQNVVLEMGYFVGSLGRDKVCVLYKGDVELPSDILGVIYTKIDNHDSWKLNLAKELKTAGYSVDLNKLIS
jgi:predicted nucleotide-binding protein